MEEVEAPRCNPPRALPLRVTHSTAMQQLPLPFDTSQEACAPLSLREELALAGIMSEGEAGRCGSKAWRLGRTSQHLAHPFLQDPRAAGTLMPDKPHTAR